MDTFFSYPLYIASDRNDMIETVEVTQEQMTAVTAIAESGSRKLSDVDKKMLSEAADIVADERVG